MVKSDFSKLFCMMVIVISINCHIVRTESNLFTKLDFHSLENGECSNELMKIATGLLKSEEWAMKIVDAWPKMPSGIFSGNFYEFGAFSQCFNIERNKEKYHTHYCLGYLKFPTQSIYPQRKHNANIPNIFQRQNEHDAIPQFQNGPGITFGMCIPAVCSVDSLEPLIIDLNHKIGNMSIKIQKNSCQNEEFPSELKTLDKATIIFLGIVLSVIVISTFYDIFCSIRNREKSQILLAFSFYTNGMKLLAYKDVKSADVMQCLHGIRAISTQWVVLGHTFMFYSMLPVQNLAVFPTFFKQYHNMIIASAPISVDTFFVISGLLVSFNMLKHIQNKNGRMNVAFLYVHRYLRLTPLLGAYILFSMSLLRFLGSGPIFPGLIGYFEQQCERNWWKTLLYIQNYVDADDICFGHSWYLAVDTQLFFIAPVVIYVIYWLKVKSIPILSVLIVGCIGCTLAVHVKYELTSLLKFSKMVVAYFPTHIRFSSWLIGVMNGYFLFKTRNTTVRIPKVMNIFFWLLSLASMAAVIFANYPLMQIDTEATPLEFGLYDALSRVIWSVAISYIIFACVHGYGGFVNSFLSHALWQPFSRLSYSIYLSHLLVMTVTMATMKTPLYFSEMNAFHAFIGNYGLTVFISILGTLAFESPIVVIEKMILGPTNKPEPFNTSERNESQEIESNISYEPLENCAD